ncbi:MAG: hypothetical protein IPP07_24665 [Holophagales bacterium]|nr:hypothetical protein [Holophagales bacterium]
MPTAPKAIRPSAAQSAPRSRSVLQISMAGPPSTGTLRSAPSDQNPIHRPSGEKNGLSAPVVPATAAAAARRRSRRNSCCVPFCSPVNASQRPSGDSAMAVRLGRRLPTRISEGSEPSSASAGSRPSLA